jgi:hypothetical protein
MGFEIVLMMRIERLTYWTHDITEYPSFKQHLSKRKRHTKCGHEKVANGQIDQKY